MTLIVEDGSVVSNAESYVDLTFFKAYCDARGISYASFTDPQLEQHARKSFFYMLQKYRENWKGYRKSALQVGDWPRSFVYLEQFICDGIGSYPYLVDENSIPVEVKYAQCELMVRSWDGDLMSDLSQMETSVTVGPISVTYNPSSDQQVRFAAADAILKPYLNITNELAASSRISRV